MIICPECGSVDVCGFWEQDLTVAVWHCRACGQRWPVTPGDGVAAAVREMDKRAVEAVREVVEKARWSTGGTEQVMNKDYSLIIFDIDGTLAWRDSGELLPGVEAWFEQHAPEHKIALATNQGGVGLRRWMEDGGFGEPDKYPNEENARAHITEINNALPGGPYPYFVCFAYQSKSSGKWAPVPDDDDPEWDAARRKPAPGMIYDAIRECGATRQDTLFVGDRDEDRGAALSAGVDFKHAATFFKRPEFLD